MPVTVHAHPAEVTTEMLTDAPADDAEMVPGVTVKLHVVPD